MNATPSSNRTRHVPTPRYEERKKKLFAESNVQSSKSSTKSVARRVICESDEDSDLGPMSPLQFSSSPTDFNQHHGILDAPIGTKRTDFANGFGGFTLEEAYSLKKVTVNLGRKLCIESGSDDPSKNSTTTDSEDGVAPLCESMEKMATDPPTPTPITAVDVFSSASDYSTQMKTPSESSTTTTSADQKKHQSFRKASLSNAELTPSENEASIPLAKHDKAATVDRPKAKTSLIFTEPTISTKSFYGSSFTVSSALLNRFGTGNATIDEKKLPIASILSKLKKQSPSYQKQSMQKRTKWTGPRLWRNGGVHKAVRFKRRIKPAKLSKIEKNTLDATTTSSDSTDNTNQRSAKKISQRAVDHPASRHKSVLKDQNSPQMAAPATGSTSDADSEYEDDDDDDPLLKGIGIAHTTTKDTENDEPEMSVNRKFFKSKTSTTTKKYQIMAGLSATLKRGNDFKLELPAKRVRRSRGMLSSFILCQDIHSSETFLFPVSHKQISSIIANLQSPKKASDPVHSLHESSQVNETSELHRPSPVNLTEVALPPTDIVLQPIETQVFADDAMTCIGNSYRQMIPYNTTDPQKISQQESILELLIFNNICNDETFKIFIAEPDLHKEKASAILDELYCVSKLLPDDASDIASVSDWQSVAGDMPVEQHIFSIPMGPDNCQLTTSTLGEFSFLRFSSFNALTFEFHSIAGGALDQAAPPSTTNEASLFPIFRKNFQEPQPVRDLYTHIANTTASTVAAASKWKPTGSGQYQIDAGQKEFGMKQCAECGMTYSVHEPEDELLHMNYHNSVAIFTFKVSPYDSGVSHENRSPNFYNWSFDRDGQTSAWFPKYPNGVLTVASSTYAKRTTKRRRIASKKC